MQTIATVLTAVSLMIAGRFVFAPLRSAHADDAKPASAEPAQTDDPNVLINKGKAEAREALLPDNESKKEEFRKQAREDFAAAREILQADHDRHKSAYDKFDKFIPKENKEQYEAREKAYRQYIQAQLLLAVLTYEEAQTWDKGSGGNKKLLADAAGAFDKIHSRYRQLVAGLYARMWQGKCYEEQDDIAKALGLYNELLGHGGGKPSPPLATLQDRVRHFRLICLNRDERKDYQIVIREAEEWLKDNEEKAAMPTGLGIQWELARALEAQARSAKTDAAKRARFLERALNSARAISREPSEFKDASDAMIERLESELDRKPEGAK